MPVNPSRDDRFRTVGAVVAVVLFLAVGLGAVAMLLWVNQLGKPELAEAPETPADAPETPAAESVPEKVAARGFVSSSACKECHPNQHASWSKTFHRTMTQLATPETVLAPFDDVTLSARGRTCRLEKRGDEFWVTMSADVWEGKNKARARGSTVSKPAVETRRVLMTTGSHHMQGYWAPRGQGPELVQIPFYYHLAEKRWIPREDVFLRPPDNDPELAQWSTTCVKCHSVAGVPGGMPMETSPLKTQVAELGIACEACHGPGEEHVRRRRQSALNGTMASKPIGDRIVNPAKAPPKVQSEICGQCHSEFVPADPIAFWTEGLPYRAGGDLEDSHRVVNFQGEIHRQMGERFDHTFWSDGTCRIGGDEYNGLIESPCYQRGELSCLSCHSMHDSEPNDMLKADMEGDRACTQCHSEPQYAEKIEEHTHHAAGASGSRCYNCHMPYTAYALMTALRSHRVITPKAEPITHRGQPNSCNLCHLDRTLQWTNDRLVEWYGGEPATFSDEEQSVAASLLWLLRGDAMQRALAAWHMGWAPAKEAAGDEWQAPFLARVLQDPYVQVRYQAVRSLQKLPQLNGWQGDFLASDDDRRKAGADALARWLREKRPADRDRQAVLLDADGAVNAPAVDNLLKRRDDRYVRIPE